MNTEIVDGAVLQDGKNVGTVGPDGEFVPAKGLHHKKVPGIRKAVKVLMVKTASGVSPHAESEFSDGAETPDGPGPNERTPPADAPPVVTPAPDPLEPPSGQEPSPAPVAPVRTKEGPEIPPAPEQDPRMGDKTPAYVAWLRQYHPAQAKHQYANRVVPA